MLNLFSGMAQNNKVQSTEYQTKYGFGTNISATNLFNSGKIAPYVFYQTKRHHFGFGLMLGRKLQQEINNFGFLAGVTVTYEPTISISGFQAHYRHFIYPPEKFFDIFLEGYVSNTFIQQKVNGESGKLGSALQGMVGLGFRFKINDVIALTQTSLVGTQVTMMPSNDLGFETEIKPPFFRNIGFGISLGLEFSINKN